MTFRILRSDAALFALLLLASPVVAALSPEEQRILAAIDPQEKFVRELAEVVKIDSVTENLAGVRKAGAFFGGRLGAIGFDTRFVAMPAETKRAGHLVAEHCGTRGKRVLLIGHLDTVFPGGTFRREGDIVFGSGVADMKGGNLVIVHALRALHRAGALADRQVIVVLTGDEESPGRPLEITRRDLIEAARRSDIALGFESVIANTATVGRRGAARWNLEVRGPTGHSSGIFSEAMGSGALYEAARIITGFHETFRKLDGLTANPAVIVGGAEASFELGGGTASGKDNIIPERVLVRGDLRFVSAAQLEEAEAAMRVVLARSLPRTTATLNVQPGFPAMEPLPGNFELLAELDRVSRDLGYAPITAHDPRARGAGDISFVSPPIPGLDGLGMGGENSHTPDESADVSRAPELIKRTALLLYRLTR